MLHQLLEESRNAKTVAPLVAFFYRSLVSATRSVPREAVACTRGCSHCCSSWVSVRAPEALFVKRAIPQGEIADIQASIQQAYAITRTRRVDARDDVRAVPIAQGSSLPDLR